MSILEGIGTILVAYFFGPLGFLLAFMALAFITNRIIKLFSTKYDDSQWEDDEPTRY